MSVPFNANEFRQQMAGQNVGTPQAPQAVVPQQVMPQQIAPQPGQPKVYAPAQQSTQIAPPPMAPQQAAVPQHYQQPIQQQQPQMQQSPMPAAHQMRPYQPAQQQAATSYSAAPMMAAHQPQAQVFVPPQQQHFTPPPAEVVRDVETPEKSIFGIKIGGKPKAPKAKKVKLEKDENAKSIITKSSILPFAAGLVLGAVGMMFLGNMVADKTDQRFAEMQASMAAAEASITEDLSILSEGEAGLNAIEPQPQLVEAVPPR